jgi:hypothetical protein
MKKIIALFTMLLALNWGLTGLMAADTTYKSHEGMAMPEADTTHKSHEGMAMPEADTTHKSHEGMAMPQTDTMEKTSPGSPFQHIAKDKNIRAEFQVMSLASMNMKDPNGATHHIMLKLFHDSENHPIKAAVGKIKIVGPDNAEQIGNLKNYSGIFAANFTFNKTGKYGVICLVKVGEENHLFKFWYPHG